MTEDDNEDYLEDMDLPDPEHYGRFTDDEGLSVNYPNLEPDPERWATVLQHDRYHDSLTQLDDLMRDYEHLTELHVGEDSFRDLNHRGEKLPDQLNFYIAQDRNEFIEEVNHPVFRELGNDHFTVPRGTNIGLAFGGYRDVIDVPDSFEFLDIKVPTFFSHVQYDLQQALEQVGEEYGEGLDPDEDYF